MVDIVVTWSKQVPLEKYLAELEKAVENNLDINFRIPSMPKQTPKRCFMVHDGYIRGWGVVRGILERGPREVEYVDGSGYWPEGIYIVRNPQWHALHRPYPMKGFQGFRYIDGDKIVGNDRLKEFADVCC